MRSDKGAGGAPPAHKGPKGPIFDSYLKAEAGRQKQAAPKGAAGRSGPPSLGWAAQGRRRQKQAGRHGSSSAAEAEAAKKLKAGGAPSLGRRSRPKAEQQKQKQRGRF